VSSPPLVSIITPAYNAAPYIAETARSVLAQTYGNWEWIVVDDGSTDATREIIAGFDDSRLRLVHTEHSGLPAVARNRGMSQARGAYVAYLDADDIWLPDKLASQLACFDANPNVGLVFSQYRRLHEDRVTPNMGNVSNPGMLFADLVFANFICASTVVVRREPLGAHGLMDEDPAQRGTEDFELWLRLAPHVPFAYVPWPLVWYRVNAHGVSHKAVPITKGRILAVEKNLKRYPDEPVHPQMVGRRMEAWKQHWLAVAQSYDGVDQCGRRAFLHSLRNYPFNVRTWAGLALSFLGPALNRRLRRFAERVL
jgi:glycosyltransferase involved in cell wall biosynthesis